MGWGRLGGPGLLALTLALASPPGAAGGASAEVAAPELSVDRLRVENLLPDGLLGVADVGEFRGALELVRSGGGVAIVNEVGLEDYVRGIAEVPSSWPMEALKAQAIAARTYALHEMGSPPPAAAALGAHICATQACQVYVGLAKERAEAGDRWVAAVEATRGHVLTRRGVPIKAMYSSGEPIPGAAPPAPPAPKKQPPPPPPPPAPPAVTPPSVPPVGNSPKLPLLPLVPPAPAPAPAGPAPSAPPPAPPAPARPAAPPAAPADAPRFRGHGMGMSQYGAYNKAVKGAKSTSILASYYKGARVTQLPADRLPATIRVALEPVRSTMVVGGSRPFRLLDGSGRLVAVAGPGQWRVKAGPAGKLLVVPPAGPLEAPVVEALVPDPATQPPGEASTVRLRLSAPAMVALVVKGPEGHVLAPSTPVFMDAGEWPLPQVALPEAGRVVSVVADAGGGRVTTVPLDLGAVEPAVGTASSPGGGTGAAEPLRRAVALALTALLLWAASALGWLRCALVTRWAR